MFSVAADRSVVTCEILVVLPPAGKFQNAARTRTDVPAGTVRIVARFLGIAGIEAERGLSRRAACDEIVMHDVAGVDRQVRSGQLHVIAQMGVDIAGNALCERGATGADNGPPACCRRRR